jgi:hypothetical protein
MNESALSATGQATVRLPLRIVTPPSTPKRTRHFEILQHSALPPVSTGLQLLVTTTPVDAPGNGTAASFDVTAVLAGPGHVGDKRRFLLDLDLQFPIGEPQHLTMEYRRADVHCGTFVSFPEASKLVRRSDWHKFDGVNDSPAKHPGECRTCRFRSSCNLINKMEDAV